MMTSLSKADAESALAEIIADRTLTRPHDNASGMSKREFFASRALAGLTGADDGWISTPTNIATRAVECADALIEALNAADTRDQ